MQEGYYLNLDALIDGDLSGYEYYVSLPNWIKHQLNDTEIHTLEDLQRQTEKLQRKNLSES